MEKEIKLPTIKKATNFKNMQPKVLKSSAHSCSETWTKLINNTMNNSEFPDELKLVEVTVIFKKDDPTKSKDYLPVSALPTVLKLLERIMNGQIFIFAENFSPLIC